VLVDLEVLDEQGGTIPSTFTAVSLDPGILVTADDNFLPEYDADGVLSIPEEVTRFRLNVIATDNIVSTTIHVTSGDLTLDIPVKTTPVEIAAGFSTTTPGLGEEITVTSPSGLLFTAATEVTFENAPNGIVTDIAADGSTLTFIAIPGTIGAPTFTEVGLAVSPDITYDLTATAEITAEPAPESIPAVFSTLTPDGGEAVTVSAAGWHFLWTTSVTIGGAAGTTIGVAADGSSLTFLPVPGSTGIPTFMGLEIEGVSGVPIQTDAQDEVTTGATVAPLAGTDDPGTAPLITTPASGETFAFYDAGSRAGDCDGVPCNWYKIEITTPGDVDFVGVWSNTTDLGVYVTDDAFTTIGACDAHGNGAGANPEECTVTFEVAGTYYIQMQDFGPFYPSDNAEPDWTFISMTAH
jgi:hypothetical protein